jgi:hypothetical protein
MTFRHTRERGRNAFPAPGNTGAPEREHPCFPGEHLPDRLRWTIPAGVVFHHGQILSAGAVERRLLSILQKHYQGRADFDPIPKGLNICAGDLVALGCAMFALTRRRDPTRQETWLIYCGDVDAGTVARAPHRRAIRYPGSRPGECTAANLSKRAAFDRVANFPRQSHYRRSPRIP